MNNQNIEFIVDDEKNNMRLDAFLAEVIENLSRSNIQKLIKDKDVSVNSRNEKSSYKVATNDIVHINIPEPTVLNVEAQDIPIDIVYEDEDILVINKHQGMVVHPAPGNYTDTLVNAIMYHCGENLSSINGVIRPGIVHRIDKNTSGLLVIAKNDYAHNYLSEQFSVHSITREYEMICVGNVDWENETVDTFIGRNPKDRLKMAVVKSGGKRAITHFEKIEDFEGFTYMKATLETGRTHQIRVHSNYIKHPIIGDDLYGYSIKKYSKLNGQMLHARKLGFKHPKNGEYIEFNSDLPKYFEIELDKLRKER